MESDKTREDSAGGGGRARGYAKRAGHGERRKKIQISLSGSELAQADAAAAASRMSRSGYIGLLVTDVRRNAIMHELERRAKVAENAAQMLEAYDAVAAELHDLAWQVRRAGRNVDSLLVETRTGNEADLGRLDAVARELKGISERVAKIAPALEKVAP